jgi:hypothetical protein
MNNDIEYNIFQKNKNNYKIYLFTVMYDNPIFFEIIEKNLCLNNIEEIIIFSNSLKLDNNFENDKIHIIKMEYNENEITYNMIFDYILNNYKNKTCILLRSDTYIENQVNLEFLPCYLQNNVFLCISSISIDDNGNMLKDDNKMKTFYSMNQDCWIFQPNENYDLDLLNKNPIKFNISRNEIFINKFLDKKYNLINDTENFKIMKKLHDDTNTLRIETKLNITDDIKLLPETTIVNKVNLENLIRYLELDEFDLYNLKSDLLKKVLIKNNFLEKSCDKNQLFRKKL